MVEDGSMRALILEDLETDLKVEEILVPEPKAEEVLLKVMAYGVCHRSRPRLSRARSLGMGRDSNVKRGTR